MKITILLLLLAVATASQLDSSDNKDEKIDPIQDQQTPSEDKNHNKRTLFRLKPIYRKRHIGIHPLGFRYVLAYRPQKFHYVLRRPQVTFLKPVIQTGGWKPVKPVIPVVPVKPVIPVKPVATPTPVLPAGTGQNPILLPPAQVGVPVSPFIPAAPTVLKPVAPAVIPLAPLINPLYPVIQQLHPFLRPFLNQFVQHGHHLDVVQRPAAPFIVPPAVPPHATRLDIVNKLVPAPQLVPTGYHQDLVPHGHHLDVINHGHQAVLPRGHHLDVVNHGHQAVLPHGNHLDVVQPAPVVPEGLVHHGNHLDLVNPALQPAVPHGNHLDLLPFKPLPHVQHYDLPQEHLHLESHVHPEQPNVVHTEAHLHQDGYPHVHQVTPQLPLYLPEHPNYKPGLTSSVQEEHSGTFPRYPLIAQ